MLDINVGPPLNAMTAQEGIRRPPLDEMRREPLGARPDSFSQTLQTQQAPAKTPVKKMGEREESTGKSKETSTDESVSKTVRKMTPMKGKPATLRERAIRKFMDSAESELGVPPQRMVEAIASLDSKKLEASPESTINDVVGNLDLPPQQQSRMTALYTDLVKELGALKDEAPMPAIAATGAAGLMSAPFVQERFMAAQERRMNVNHGLDQLNDKFWARTQAAAGPIGGAAAMAATPALGDDALAGLLGADAMALDGEGWDVQSMPQDGFEGLPQREGELPPELGRPSSREQALQDLVAKARAQQSADPKAMNAMSAKQKQIYAELMREKGYVPPQGLDGQAVNDGSNMGLEGAMGLNAGAMNAVENPYADSGAQGFSQQQFAGQQGQNGMGSSEKSILEEMKAKSSDHKSAKLEGSPLAALSADPAPLKDLKALGPAVPVAGAAIAVPNTEKDVNIQALMKQAQFLIKKGGGEMKVEMSPEGLGNIHLKVMLQDGKVNVQMAAESNEAKKAVESSLSELRSNLSAHKLSVDQVKIDVVSNVNADNQARDNMNNPNSQQQNRDMRQFWNQFQENFGNSAKRDGYFDMPDTRQYRQNKSPNALQPLSTESSSKRAAAPGKGRGLDLVA